MPLQLPARGCWPGGLPGNHTRHCPALGRCPGGTLSWLRSSSSLTTTTRETGICTLRTAGAHPATTPSANRFASWKRVMLIVVLQAERRRQEEDERQRCEGMLAVATIGGEMWRTIFG